jgi:beta-glucosidase
MSFLTDAHRIAAVVLFTLLSTVNGRTQTVAAGKHEDAKTETRIDQIIARMTLDEKIDALGTDPAIPRLGISGSGHVEGLHGLALGGPGDWQGRGRNVIATTTFPQARGLGQTWDPALLRQIAAVEADEARYYDLQFHRGGLVIRAPNADLSRDPRWGRSEESYGEDPFLVGTLATAFTEGLQGTGTYWRTASLLKHFLANSNEDGRDGSSSDFDTRLFHEYYAVPFRMAIEDGEANAMMTSYNAWNKVPMTANPVLRSVVMKDWGFDGILCTDAGALTNMVKAHHAYATLPEATAAAIHAGINQFLDNYKQPLRDALAEHLVTEKDLDLNLRGIYRVMIRLGLLDGDNRFEQPARATEAERRALVRKATDESIVLLKNTSDSGKALLPLEASAIKSIAVIGPLADTVALDWYSGTAISPVSPLAGIRARAGSGVQVTYASGDDLGKVAMLAKAADVAIVIIGNNPTCGAGWMKCPTPSDGKEAVDRKSLTLAQESLAMAAYAANPHTVVVLQTSFPFTTTWTQEHIPSVLEMTHNSEEQGNGLADVLFGDYDPAGRLTQTWVTAMDQLPPMMDYDLRHGRTYLYAKEKPLYAFGYGLSYTQFLYSGLSVARPALHAGDSVDVSVKVTNQGRRAGEEVVQLYVSHQGSSVSRPKEELKGFDRVLLQPGETRTVTLPLSASSLRFWSDSGNGFELEKDAVEVRVGGSSDNLPLHKTVQIQP